MERTRYIFTSDLHLGAETGGGSEDMFVDFLERLPQDTKALYLLGDIFDFWFEKRRRKMGFDRTLDALRQTVESGVELYFLRGNHDWWTFGLLERKTGLKVLEPQPVSLNIDGTKFCLAHGDGLGKIGVKERFIQWLLKGRFTIALARYLVPASWLYALAAKWSRSSRHGNLVKPYVFTKDSPLYRFASDYEKEHPVDYFIFGHIHRHIEMNTPGGAKLYILDEWSNGPDWLEFDGRNMIRKNSFEEETPDATDAPRAADNLVSGSAGISAPLFSLRSEGGAGIGDIGDLKQLTDLAETLGLRKVVATHIVDRTILDSIGGLPIYPVYMDLRQLGHLLNQGKEAEYMAAASELDKQQIINYTKVYNTKMHFLNDRFRQDGLETLSSDAYHIFWKANKSWLEQYAAYCTLRHKYGTGNNKYWSEPNYTSLLSDVHFIREYSEDLQFHCYVQFLLHRQMEDARAYAAEKGIEMEVTTDPDLYSADQAPAGSLRLWWENMDERERQSYFNDTLGLAGEAPATLDGWIAEMLIKDKLLKDSSAILPLSDWISVTSLSCIRQGENIADADVKKQGWRMDLSLESLLKHKALLKCVKGINERTTE